jgi:hypothetical protein
VTGTVKLDDASGSLYLEAQTAEAGADSAILPLGMVNRSVGGGVFANQAATVNGVGLNSVGLLVRVWGYASSLGGGYYSLSDGSAEAVRVLVLAGTVPTETVWAATGVLSTYKDGSDVRPLLIVNNAATDIQGF